MSRVSGSKRFSFLDGYLGYNQILVQESDQYKSAFTTKWGIYSYCKMSFGLTNAGATFQKLTDLAFKSVLAKFVLMFLGDITIYSKCTVDHFDHPEQVCIKCKEYGVSLNPSKWVFATNQGRLLGPIVSKDALAIDPKRVEDTIYLPIPSHKKGIQSFLGRINFVRRFIPNLSTMVKNFTSMLKKNYIFSCTKEGNVKFEEIKKAISQDPTLVNPSYEKYFILYTLGGESSISFVLTDK